MHWEWIALGDIIQIVALVFLVWQVVLARRGFKADHERQKKQSTIEYLNAISEKHRARLSSFDNRHGRFKVVDVSEMSDEDIADVRGFLTEIERFCLGINLGVFDFDVAERCNGTMLVTQFNRFRHYIEDVRRQRNSSSFYSEYEVIADKIKSCRGQVYDNRGAIVHS